MDIHRPIFTGGLKEGQSVQIRLTRLLKRLARPVDVSQKNPPMPYPSSTQVPHKPHTSPNEAPLKPHPSSTHAPMKFTPVSHQTTTALLFPQRSSTQAPTQPAFRQCWARIHSWMIVAHSWTFVGCDSQVDVLLVCSWGQSAGVVVWKTAIQEMVL